MIRKEFTKIGALLYDAPDWMHPIPSWIAAVLPRKWKCNVRFVPPEGSRDGT